MTRYIAIAKEDSFGNEQTTFTEYLDAVRESVRPTHNIIEVETAGAGRSLRHILPGPYGLSGDIDFVVGPESIDYILYGATGDHTQTQDSGGNVYKHEYKPATTLPSFTIEICPDVGSSPDYARRLIGCGFSSLRFEAVAREVLTCTASIVGKTEKLVTPSTPTFSTLRPFYFADGQVKWNGTEIARIEAFRCTLENTIADDAFVLGSRFLPALITGPCNVTGDMDMQFLDWSYYQEFLGSSGATQPGTTIDSVSIELNFLGDSTGSSDAGFENYAFKIELPRVYLNTASPNFDRRERLVLSMEWSAAYDPSSGYVVKFTTVNKKNRSTEFS